MSYVQRDIQIQFILGQGSFGETGSDTVTVRGLRISCTIVKAGGLSLGGAQVRIYGLPLSVMNQLNTLGMPLTFTRRNTIIISAGDVGGQLSKVYEGTIIEAWADLDSQPEAAFNVEAYVAAFNAASATKASSFKGISDVATVLGVLVTKCNPVLTLENHGVNVKLSDVYLSGSPINQIQQVCEHANISYVIDKGVLAIWPSNGSRGTNKIIIEPPPAGTLVGYPKYTGQGIQIKIEFTPVIEYGNTITLKSSIPAACGDWIVYKLTYNLEAQVPGGEWFCDIEATSFSMMQANGGVLPLS